MSDGISNVRLRPLPATAYEYQGRADEVPVVEALLGARLRREENGDIPLSCPVPRGGDSRPGEPRHAVLRPGMVVVRFTGEPYRFTVGDAAAYRFMYEEVPSSLGEALAEAGKQAEGIAP